MPCTPLVLFPGELPDIICSIVRVSFVYPSYIFRVSSVYLLYILCICSVVVSGRTAEMYDLADVLESIDITIYVLLGFMHYLML